MTQDMMDPCAYPWPHRYPFTTIDPRTFYTSAFTPGGAAINFATHSLFNGSTGDRVLVVRSISWAGAPTTAPLRFEKRSGTFGTHAGSETPIWANERSPAGQHWFLDSATLFPADEFVAAAATGSMFRANQPPIAVLPPGWSLLFQPGAVAGTVLASWYWEELLPDDPHLGSLQPRL